jgi:murein DD-endopeptidase MepM/ murein hydrolase activator NlpD
MGIFIRPILAKKMANYGHFPLTKTLNKSTLLGQCIAALWHLVNMGSNARQPMTMHIKKFLVLVGVRLFHLLRRAVTVTRLTIPLLLVPLRVIWKFVLRPITIILYKLYIVFGERLKTFFHAQHKILSIITHRFAIHVFVVLLTTSIVVTNTLQANEVRAEEFAEGSLIAKIFRPEEETTVTAESVTPVRTSYIDPSRSLKLTPRISGELQRDTEAVMVASGGAAFVKSNTLGNSAPTNTAIQQYVVQGGDTISSIADQFSVSTQTVLWSNNLGDSSIINPGDTLYILPTTGVAHTVASGETVSGIAEKYGASADEIIEYNKLLNAQDLVAGVEIVVPNGKQPAPVAPRQTTQLATFRQAFTSGGSAPTSAALSGTKLQWPTTTHRISQYYTGFHTGLDIDGNFGDPIYAAESGTVSSVGWYSGYGLQIVISHPSGLKTRYAHLQKVFVSQGQSVGRGAGIGEMGSTGYSSGSHLHFETIVGSSFSNPFNYY